ncbi:hypothetical protein [Arsenophonus sp.]|uniref:hypothetical protein n=1 Tax=Arsenophonus sp. TaxID=1872640 RepID=UPI003878F828
MENQASSMTTSIYMDKRLTNVIAARENERINMDKLFISVKTGNHQDNSQTAETNPAGMTQQKDQTPKTKIQHPESSETLEPPDEKHEKSQINGQINRHHQQRKEEININRPSVKQDIGDTL